MNGCLLLRTGRLGTVRVWFAGRRWFLARTVDPSTVLWGGDGQTLCDFLDSLESSGREAA